MGLKDFGGTTTSPPSTGGTVSTVIAAQLMMAESPGPVVGDPKSFILQQVPADASQVAVYLNGQRCTFTSDPQGRTEFSVDVATKTVAFGIAPDAADVFQCDYAMHPPQSVVLGEDIAPSGGTAFDLTTAPRNTSEVAVYLNGQRLEQANDDTAQASLTNSEFAMQPFSANNRFYTGYAATSEDVLIADYLKEF